MSCYSYSSNDPIYFEPNIGIWSVERVYNVGDTYSYAAIARMCEVADKDQLCVYTRPSPTGTETKLTLNVDYTVVTATETISIPTPPASGQVVIRRCTANTKMFIPFTEGAKLTAQQLNTSLYQLLFISQEKEFVGSTINEYYPIAIAASAWNSGTPYVVNNYVLHNGNIYKALTNHSNSQPPSANWTLINPATNGFVIEGNLSGPVKFDLTGTVVGQGLVWNGTKFEAGYFAGQLDNLSDVTITNPIPGQILVRNISSQWVNTSPTVDITIANPVFQSHIFVNQATSYTNDNTSFPTITTTWTKFRNPSNQWNIASIPTVWHALNLITPGYIHGNNSTYFDQWLVNVNTTVNAVSQAVTNPVKVKLFWNLNKGRNNITDNGIPTENLQNYKSTFWDDPKELYNTGMWSNPISILSHGVATDGSGSTQKTSAYWNSINGAFTSKVSGYGLQTQGFYLSIPECYTTSLVKIPIIKTNGTTASDHVFVIKGDLTSLKLAGLKGGSGSNESAYSDLYLENIRDLAFAASFTKPSPTAGSWATDTNNNFPNGTAGFTPPTIYNLEQKARWTKGNLFSADYSGFEDVSYKRLETSETAKTCLFKIPKQIIYYNKHALGFSYSTTTTNLTTTNTDFPNTVDNTGLTIYSKQTRFDGPSKMNYTANANSSLTSSGMGNKYKADSTWNEWCTAWSDTPTEFTFNESDIEWIVSNIATSNGDTLNLWSPWNPSSIANASIPLVSPGYLVDKILPARQFPWPYRSSYFDRNGTAIDGFIGHHIMNVDFNKIFSESHNYVPDPRDEYVFRVVTARNRITNFKKAGSSDIASAIILEHGFTDSLNNASTDSLLLAQDIYRSNNILHDSLEARSRLNRNDIKVFIKNEHLERYDNDPNNLQYVITLCISVPRLKSIGYSRIYRKPNTLTTDILDPRAYASGSATIDTEKDLGPWSFYLGETDGLVYGSGTVGSSNYALFDPGNTAIYGTNDNPSINPVAGRNECAVKFTRLGIPSDLWIRLSVLNTDGSTSLLTGAWS